MPFYAILYGRLISKTIATSRVSPGRFRGRRSEDIPMRMIRITLVVLLILATIAFVTTSFIQTRSGKDQGPKISCQLENLEISVSADKSAFMVGLTASDPQDGDLTDQIILGGLSKLITADTAKATYYVFDSDNNMASFSRFVRYTDYRMPTFALDSPLVFESNSTVSLTGIVTATDVIDGDLTEKIRVSVLSPTRDSEVYSVTVQVTNSMGDLAKVELPVIVQEQRVNRPNIKLRDYLLYLPQGSEFDPQQHFAYAIVPGKSFSFQDLEIINEVDTSQPGTYWVWYTHTGTDFVGTAILTVVVE